jgi:DNA-binding transcriptional MerR regulator
MSEQIYTVTQFAKLIGVHVKTLQRWDRTGVFTARRTVTKRRYYTDEDYQRYTQGGNPDATHKKDSD